MLTKKTAKISPVGLEFIKKGEGHYGKVYDDLSSKTKKYSWGSSWNNRNFKGTPTIGYGHVVWSKWVDERSRWTDYLHSGSSFLTKDQAHKLLVADLPRYEKPVRSYLNDKAKFTQNMWDALISMAYNTGPYAKSIKKVSRAINEGKYNEAADIIRGGPQQTRKKDGTLIYLKGLTNRRNKEADLFLKDADKSTSNIGLSIASVGIPFGVSFLSTLFWLSRSEE
jgi:lysozyme